jgi:uncharacterized repeat protein (TIGR03803 family)
MKRHVSLLCLFALAFALKASAATEKILHNFATFGHGYEPVYFIGDGVGNFYVAAGGGSSNYGVVAKFSPGANGLLNETVLHNFTGGSDGVRPVVLFLDPSGTLFGLTISGGANDAGTFFEITPGAHGQWVETVLYSFSNLLNGYVSGGLAEDAAGNFYGTTDSDDCCGSTNYGSVFQLTQTSPGVWTQNVLHVFSGGADGGRFFGLLTVDQSGNVYGAAFQGGINNNGLIFEFVPGAGGVWTENVLYDFVGGKDGSGPGSALTFDQAGNLYGTTEYGGEAPGCGTRGCGAVFELKKGAGGQWSDSILYAFSNSGVGAGAQDVIFDAAGNLVGTLNNAGSVDGICCGVVFKLTPQSGGAWTEQALWIFKEQGDGGYPTNVVLNGQGEIYGATFEGGATGNNGGVFELRSVSGDWKLSTVYQFPGTDAGYANTGLIADASGNFYGGGNAGGIDDIGAIYKLAPNSHGGWQESVIYSIPAVSGSYYGADPSGLVFDTAGNLYGTEGYSGAINHEYGSIFKLTPTTSGPWSETTLSTFSGTLSHPLGNMVFDKAGNLYGTSLNGGASGNGAVFELTPQKNGTWTRTTIYNFAGYPADGANPGAGLIIDAAGNLYGTTENGGSSGVCLNSGGQKIGCGTAFELQPVSGGGWKETVLYSFGGPNGDGAVPVAPLIFDADGNLYGTTLTGGPKSKDCPSGTNPAGCGIVFELFPNIGGGWTETILHEFTNDGTDGGGPEAGLIFDKLGNLYGTASYGGANKYGTVYELSPSSGGGWTETILQSFGAGTDGETPEGGLILDSAGNLYGTTYAGGTASQGTIFEITP